MRLKKIKLAGFKSFVDPTTIPFPDDMTAIVGPNGCGKSNVIDAVRWVLGESSAKNLRGDAMTDVIFNGSTARKPVSQCSVELVFDNSSGRIQGEYAGYNELSVKRIVTKDAQSSYLLNNSKCRRRDVTDLFLGTGLGPRSYAIIEQGMISRLIESKPQELRVFIEEAAGVSKYKERRRETETRIRHTKENLERLADVRGELGQQLEKLQRQAAAAKRYKELKQQERTLKGQLAAIRWLKHSKKIEGLELDIEKKNNDIEAYVTRQRGEEKDLTEFKEKQQELKLQLGDVQQHIFKVATDISRIEQNQIHTKQRRQKVEQEISVLQSAIYEHDVQLQQHSETLSDLYEQLSLAEPEKQVLEEQLDEAQEQLFSSEQHANQQQSQWRMQEQSYQNSKQQAQACHGQIQSLLSMQQRTEQRISDIKIELSELVDAESEVELEQVHARLAELQQQVSVSGESWQKEQDGLVALQQQVKHREQQKLSQQGDLQQIKAQLSALRLLQKQGETNNALADTLSQHKLKYDLWWQTLEVKAGWEKAFECLTQHWQQAVQLENASGVLPYIEDFVGSKLLLLDEYSDNIPPNSVAAKLHNPRVPTWLCDVFIAETIEQAKTVVTSLAPHQSVITPQGYWLGHDWLIVGTMTQQGGLLERASQISQLEELQSASEKRIQHLEDELDELQGELENATQKVRLAKSQHDGFQQQHQQVHTQLTLLQGQVQQNTGRIEKLQNELIKQQELAADEEEQLAQLSMQAEELELSVADLHEQQAGIEQAREANQSKIQIARNQVDNSKTKLHQLALYLQSIQSQYSNLQTTQAREAQQLKNMHEKLAELKAEFIELSLPLEDQAENLQLLLEQRAALDLQQQDLTEQLSEIDKQISLAEKGQQGVTDKIQAMLTELQSIKLECEGYRVRANGVLEQLQELQQSLDVVLEHLPQGADENLWQQELEKTSAAVARLGAVNLAAVEEYEIQAERKLHLDTQNDDLVSALDTLEQAIRKIDKETRSRFKETFDQVNEDLKMLFPKVFGGGSAYLELTDDDLLETGVSIMARPPGKKNSTIHLLSGGEKALTALSLVFAIFRLNPAPFCLLDEVDAPLDDANVGRFCKLVSEMSKTVQFIYITHNKIAMEMATHLTGVTMSEPGVSRMVAVDVEEAVAIAQA
ncbi:MAG: chromosome segregation protein SMC [Paraglaciecola sp.]|nr:chromosome segregation protein SMC [Paraglaciecola sp.]